MPKFLDGGCLVLVGTLAIGGCHTWLSGHDEWTGGPDPAPMSKPVPMNERVSMVEPVPVAEPPVTQVDSRPVAAPMVEPVPVTPAPLPVQATYTIRRGDTLWSIAQRTYGQGKRWRDIVAVNPGLDPAALKVGQQIVLP